MKKFNIVILIIILLTGLIVIGSLLMSGELKNQLGFNDNQEVDLKFKESYSEDDIARLVNQGYQEVASAKDLDEVRNDLGGKYIQTKNIDLSSIENFEPIGNEKDKFTGTYVGGNSKITGLTISKPESDHVGFFGYTSEAKIENVTIDESNIEGNHYTGILVGYTEDSDVKNSHVKGEVKGGSPTGGLVGYTKNSLIVSSDSEVILYGKVFTGGLIGQLQDSQVFYSSSNGEIKGEVNQTGGLVGRSINSAIRKSYSLGNVLGEGDYTGGLVGYQYSSYVSDSYSHTNVKGNDYVGGLVGNKDDSAVYNSYSIGNVYGEGERVGGLIGYSNQGEIGSSYYGIELTGQESSAEGLGLTREQMKKQSNYTGWNFGNEKYDWTMEKGEYPVLVIKDR